MTGDLAASFERFCNDCIKKIHKIPIISLALILLPAFPANSAVQFFLFLNDLAGRFSFIDELARWFTISAVPMLATLFLAQVLVLPRREDAPPRSRLLFAMAFSLLFVAFMVLVVEFFAQSLNLGTISPRPFMTRRVNLLLVEPQDNSFPCFEVALAAMLAVGLAFGGRKWGILGAIGAISLALTRMFCGVNYFADVTVGLMLGAGAAAMFGAMFGIYFPVFRSKPAFQSAFSTGFLLLTLGGTYFTLAATPRFASKLPVFWGSPASAATSDESDAPKSTRAAREVLQEGEGMGEHSHEPPSAEELALSKRSHLFLPDVEKFLRGRLTPLARPFRLLDVEVAPLKTGDWEYRCAALRFEIVPSAPDARRRTAEIAARLVKAAFFLDSKLQNVDVTAIVRGDATQIDGSLVRFAGDEVPVFTASISRQNLRVAAPRWANDPNLDAGSWLRTRSRLFINEKVLPPAFQDVAEPIPTPIPQPVAGKTNSVNPQAAKVSGTKAQNSPQPHLTPKKAMRAPIMQR
jgi:membrane-associated phospholipid phosphatase